MGKEILFILSLVSLITSPATSLEDQWTEHIKNFIEKININMDDVNSMTRNIFGSIEQNCGYDISMENYSPLPTPLEVNNSACDIELYDYLKRGMKEPSFFDSEYFITKLWESKYGEAFLKSLKEKGVDEVAAKSAVKELWFTPAGGRDTAFNRVFYGKGDPRKKEIRNFNSWYTFSIRMEEIYCIRSLTREYFPLDVFAVCAGDSEPSWFIYPNHPFMDIIIYSLCAWRNDNDQTNYRKKYAYISFPGSRRVFEVRAWFHTNKDNSTYLYNADMYFSYEQ